MNPFEHMLAVAGNPEGVPRFTPAEMEVLRLLSEGLSNKEIAARRGVEEFTVRDQLSHIYRKLDVSNRVAALAKLRRLGWEG